MDHNFYTVLYYVPTFLSSYSVSGGLGYHRNRCQGNE
jgi:hypothetical protein